MSDPLVLICGGAFNEEERNRLMNTHHSLFIESSDEIGGMAEAVRGSVRSIAFKGHHPLKADHMDLLPDLGLVANYGVGYDAIDVKSASERGIRVTNTPDVLSDDVADIAVALILVQSRNIILGSEWVRSGRWAREGEMRLNRRVSGAKAGIVGLGRIGREIANRLAAFKMEIHYHSRSEKETPGWIHHADPVSLARAVDYLVVALVGGAETKNYVSREVIEAMAPRGVLINISRGTTVDEGALLDALEAGTIGGAGLDVYLNEPNIDPRFLALDNVVLQPHQGSGSLETRRAMAELQLANITAFLAGEDLLTPVN
jgi:lactate dehydrogenase-like 2-hydroxyacid dehydrogenase